jgi:hypothetical protein
VDGDLLMLREGLFSSQKTTQRSVARFFTAAFTVNRKNDAKLGKSLECRAKAHCRKSLEPNAMQNYAKP